MNLGKEVKFTRCVNSTAAGITAVNGTVLDMQGYDGVLFVAALGALTATQVTGLKAQGGAAANGSDAADITSASVGPMADADSNKCLVLDVFRPQSRYVRPVVTRGTANAVVDGVLAIQYHAIKKPTVQDATVSASALLAN